MCRSSVHAAAFALANVDPCAWARVSRMSIRGQRYRCPDTARQSARAIALATTRGDRQSVGAGSSTGVRGTNRTSTRLGQLATKARTKNAVWPTASFKGPERKPESVLPSDTIAVAKAKCDAENARRRLPDLARAYFAEIGE